MELSDEAATARITMPPLGDPTVSDPPQWLRVESRRRAPTDFDCIVQPLRRLCQAAAAAGNRVGRC